MSTKELVDDWKSTKETALSLGVSKDKMLDWIKSGIFKPGLHYRNLSPGKNRPTYRFNLEAIEKIFEV